MNRIIQAENIGSSPNVANAMLGTGFRILIACEESDEVRSRFEAYGFDAWSCDLQPNRNPKAKHYQGNGRPMECSHSSHLKILIMQLYTAIVCSQKIWIKYRNINNKNKFVAFAKKKFGTGFINFYEKKSRLFVCKIRF